MEVEAAIHALRWIASRGDSQTTHAVILTDSVSLLQKVSASHSTLPTIAVHWSNRNR